MRKFTELEERYIKDIERIRPYWEHRKNLGTIVELSDGKMVEIPKPTIKKDFCFGYSEMLGVPATLANKELDNARTNPQYFLDKNLECLNDEIKDLEDSYHLDIVYSFIRNDSKICGFMADEKGFIPTSDYSTYFRLSDSDRAILLDAYRKVRERFVKRLNTYLKRYGLSKLNTWVYDMDD